MGFGETFFKSCHHDCDVIADEQFLTLNWIVKKCHFLRYIEKDIFGGNLLAGSFNVGLEPISEEEKKTFEDILDFDIKNMV